MLDILKNRFRSRSRSGVERKSESKLSTSSQPTVFDTLQRVFEKCTVDSDVDLPTTSDEPCVICLDATPTVTAYPCGHRVTCRRCSARLLEDVLRKEQKCLPCVLCRCHVQRFMYSTKRIPIIPIRAQPQESKSAPASFEAAPRSIAGRGTISAGNSPNNTPQGSFSIKK